MSNEIIAKLRSEGESERTDVEVVQEAADEIERLEQDLARFRTALEEIRDHPFEQSNSPRLIDQLWHFVRWSKATARTALERSKTNGKSARAEES
ncbi:MAG: hypothetical protein HKN84_05935 [Gammaproteobacteria bacterium]|nr:hypothetical protein [Gammaproteobacteria bacterium]